MNTKRGHGRPPPGVTEAQWALLRRLSQPWWWPPRIVRTALRYVWLRRRGARYSLWEGLRYDWRFDAQARDHYGERDGEKGEGSERTEARF